MTGNSINKRKLQIVVLDGSTLNPGDLSWAPFEDYGNVKVYQNTDPSQLLDRSQDADVLVVNKVIIDKTIIDNLPDLKAICVTATGMNNIDLETADTKGLPVFNVVGYGTASVAQHVFALILHFTNKVATHNQAVRENAWSNQLDFSFTLSPMHELAGKIIGIYGFGNIGRAVAKIGKAFGMHIIVNSSYQQLHADVEEFVSLEDLFRFSDVVTVHTQLDKDNAGIIDLSLLSLMKREAILINTGRGGLINERDLEVAVRDGVLAGAALDVLNEEPPPVDHPFFKLHNIIITPHNAWATVEARQRLMQMAADQLKKLVISQ